LSPVSSYSVTGKNEYLNLAKRFDKKWFFDPLAAHRDELKGLHANTHIPQVIAAAQGSRACWLPASLYISK
jgi:hypothetical protein